MSTTASGLQAHVWEPFVTGAAHGVCRRCGQARSHHIQPTLDAAVVNQTLDFVWHAAEDIEAARKRLPLSGSTAAALRTLLGEAGDQLDAVRKLIEAAKKQ